MSSNRLKRGENQIRLIPGGDTRRGKGHIRNEDNFWLPNSKWPAAGQLASKGCLYIVADGVGGHARGDEASRIAVERIPADYYQHPSPDIADSLTGAVRAANRQIYTQAQQPDHYGMSSAVVAAVIRGQELVTANLGDSRAYLLQNGTLQRLTADHTWVAEQVVRGILNPEEAANHPQRGVLTRALGIAPEVTPEIRSYAISPGDHLLLCSDGVWGVIETEIPRYLQGQTSPKKMAKNLVERVAALQGADDATAVVITVEVKRGLLAYPQNQVFLALVLLISLFALFTVIRLNGARPAISVSATETITPLKEMEKIVPPAANTPSIALAEGSPITLPAATPTALPRQSQYCVSPIKNPAFPYVQLFDAVNCKITRKLPVGKVIHLPPDSVYKEYPCSGEAMLIRIEYQGLPYRMYPWRIGRLENGQCIPMPDSTWRIFLGNPRNAEQNITQN